MRSHREGRTVSIHNLPRCKTRLGDRLRRWVEVGGLADHVLPHITQLIDILRLSVKGSLASTGPLLQRATALCSKEVLRA